MKSFEGKIAVVTGGGSGMGRELALQLVAMGCDVAICDVFPVWPKPSAAACRRRGKARAS